MSCSIRLNACKRSQIMKYAEALIDCPKERKAEEKTHKKVMALIDKYIKTLATDEEMVVLKKFNALQQVIKIHFYPQNQDGSNYNNYYSFFFAFRGEDIPRNERSKSYRDVPGKFHEYGKLNVDKTTLKKWQKELNDWLDTHKAHDAARKKILDAIKAAVYGCTTLKRLGELWPPAMDLAAEMSPYTPPKLDDKAKATLKTIQGGTIKSGVRKDKKLKKDLMRSC